MQTDTLQFSHLTESQAREAASWIYSGEYSIYNYLPWEELVSDDWAITKEDARQERFFGLTDAQENLLATTQFTTYPDGNMLGIGVNPSTLSKGIGACAITNTVEYLKEHYPNDPIYLEVRTWNARAVHCYEKAGFAITDTFEQETHIGPGEFYRMYCKA